MVTIQGAKTIQLGRIVSLTNGAVTNGYPQPNNKVGYLPHTICKS